MRVRTAGPLVALAVILPGCGAAADLLARPPASTAPSSAAPTPDPRAERRDIAAVQALMDARAEALISGDKKAFLAQLDPDDWSFVHEQTVLFDNVQQLPFAVLEYDVTELLPEQNVTSYDERVLLPRTVLRYRFRGYDPATPASVSQLYTLVRRDDEWKVASDDDLVFAGDRREPWEYGPIEVEDTGRLLVVGDAGDGAQRIVQALRLARTAVRTIERELPVQWDHKLVVYATTNAALFESYGFPRPNAGAITAPLTRSRRGEQPVVRVLVNPDLPRMDPVIFTHEATHVATAAYPDIPKWLDEGIAEYVGERARRGAGQEWPAAFASKAQQAAPELPDSNGFYEGAVHYHYLQLWMAWEYIVERYGSDMLVRLANAMNSRPHLYSLDQQQDAVLLRLLGIDSAQLAEAASDLLVRRFG